MMEKINSLTSESVVIGGLLNDLNLFLSLPVLKKQYFSNRLNQKLMTTLKKIFASGAKSVDLLDVYGVIEVDEKDKKILDTAGGIDYLETLRYIAEDKDEEEIVLHAQTIIDCAYKNTMSDTLNGLQSCILENKEYGMNDLNKIIEEKLLEVKGAYSQLNKIESLGNRMTSILNEMDANNNSGISGYPTFSPTLNKFVTYEKGELIVISAKAKRGKSQWITNEIYNLSIKQGVPSLVLDTELNDVFFTTRLISRVTGYKFGYIKRGLYKENEVASRKVEEAIELISKAPIFHQYIVGWSNEQILNEVKRLKIQSNIQILFFDYLKIDEAGVGVSEHQQLGNLTNFLKNDIAGALKIAVVAFAQQSDYTDNGVRIADSARIKNYASTVMFLLCKNKEQYARDYDDLGGNYYVYIPWNRNGCQMGEEDSDQGVNITFDKSRAYMVESQYQTEYLERLLEENEYE